MSSPNLNFQQALQAFSRQGADQQVFRTAVKKYIETYNKTVNQQIKNILSGTNYQNINTRQKLLNRLAQQTSQAVKNATQVGVSNNQLVIINRNITALLKMYKQNFNNSKGNPTTMWNASVRSTLNPYNKTNINKILRSNYARNDAFTKEVRRVLGIAVPPPLPPKPTLPPPPPLPPPPNTTNELRQILKQTKMIYNVKSARGLVEPNKNWISNTNIKKLTSNKKKTNEIILSNYSNSTNNKFVQELTKALTNPQYKWVTF